jgi:hypothetical protein
VSSRTKHFELTRQQRKLDNKNRSGRGRYGKKRLRKADGKDFVCHERSPLIESIER